MSVLLLLNGPQRASSLTASARLPSVTRRLVSKVANRVKTSHPRRRITAIGCSSGAAAAAVA